MLSATAIALCFSSCGDKSISSPNKRVEHAGFIAKLPQDTGFISSVYEPKELWLSLRNSALAQALCARVENDNETAKEGEKLLPSITAKEDIILQIMGQEILVAQYGDTAAQLNNWGEYLLFIQSCFQDITMNDGHITLSDAEKAQLTALNKKTSLPSIVIALKNEDMAFSLLKASLDEKINKLAKNNIKGITKTEHTVNSVVFSGYKFDGSPLASAIDDSQGSSPIIKESLTEILKGKNAYLLLGRIDGYSVLFLVDELSKVKLAETPTSSIINSPELAFLDNYTGKKPVSISFVSSDITQALLSFSKKSNINSWERLIEQTTELMPKLSPEQSAELSKTLKATTTKYQALLNYSMQDTTSIGIWGGKEQGYKFDIWGMPTNAYNLEKPLLFAPRFNTEDTFLYCEANSSDKYAELEWNFVDQLGENIITFADIAFSSPEQASKKALYDASKSSIIEIGKNFKTMMVNGLGNDAAFLMSPLSDVKSPLSLSLLCEVKNREQFLTGWNNIRQASNKLGTQFMQDQWTAMLPVITQEKLGTGGDAMTLYTIPAPFPPLEGWLSPSSALNANMVILGSSSAEVKSLITKSNTSKATPSNPSSPKGFVFSFRMEPFVKSFKKLGLAQRIYPYIDAAQKDFKGIHSGIETVNGKTKFTIHLITQ